MNRVLIAFVVVGGLLWWRRRSSYPPGGVLPGPTGPQKVGVADLLALPSGSAVAVNGIYTAFRGPRPIGLPPSRSSWMLSGDAPDMSQPISVYVDGPSPGISPGSPLVVTGVLMKQSDGVVYIHARR